jgi:hypothetical protein
MVASRDCGGGALNAAGLGVTEDDDEATESTGILRDFWLFLNLSVSNASFYEMTQVVSETKKQTKKTSRLTLAAASSLWADIGDKESE